MYAMPKNLVPGLVINGDKPPKKFEGYKVYKHIKCGKILYTPSKFNLFFTEQQLGNPRVAIPGEEHYRSLSFARGLANGNFMDFFEEHPETIPNEMKGCDKEENPLYTFFPKTVYQHIKTGALCIRYARMHKGQLESYLMEINGEFGFPSYYPSLRLSN